MSKILVVYHSADFDGLFCREIARRALPDAEFIGWDFKDLPLALPQPDVQLYVLDLPLDRPFGLQFGLHRTVEPVAVALDLQNTVWIDHHQSSMETHPEWVPGYRINGVAACRLAYQYFVNHDPPERSFWHQPFAESFVANCNLPHLNDYVERRVKEPWAVRLAGEYDIWDKRDPDAELFQFGLKSQELDAQTWKYMLDRDPTFLPASQTVRNLLEQAKVLKFARDNEYAQVIEQQGFDLYWEGINFLACNSHELDIRSHLFEAGIRPRHEALLGFTYHGGGWRVSMYRVPGNQKADILSIARKYGGGGHPGACGFQPKTLPFPLA